MSPDTAPDSIELTLASHTNVGKTTLLRTLLGKDVGEVRDEAHVTQFSERYTWLETAQGEALKLWDTPGFGDSQRLEQRMRLSGTPLGWLLRQVWDRLTNPGFYYSQLALHTVKDSADVVLYLVNAADFPAASAEVLSEMRIIEWTGKPVIVLLNQLGEQRTLEQDAADISAWTQLLAPFAQVRTVLALDAFTRCWVQEFRLLAAIEEALPAPARRALLRRLANELRERHLRVFSAATVALADCVTACALARVEAETPAGQGRLRGYVDRLLGRSPDLASAGAALRAQAGIATTGAVIALIAAHGLDARMRNDIEAGLAVTPGKAARGGERLISALGPVAGGMLGGLLTDLMTGGLSLGLGALLGGAAGLVGGRVAALEFNRISGSGGHWVEWSPAALNELIARLLMAYLVVAHAGRGRGPATLEREQPRWREAVPALLASRRATLEALWASRAEAVVDPTAGAGFRVQLLALVADLQWAALIALYPEADRLRVGD